LWYIFRW